MQTGESIYVLHDKATSEFRYSPFFALAMSGLSRFSEDNADTIWYLINFFLLIASFVYLNKLIIRAKLKFSQMFLLYFILLAITNRTILHTFDCGQANILMLASIIIGLYYISQKQEIKGGFILALSIMIKYTPLIFIAYFLIKRRFKVALIIAAALFTYYLLPSLFIGHKTNLNYVKDSISFLTQSTILDKGTIYDYDNQSLLSAVCRFTTHRRPDFMPFYKSFNLSDAGANQAFAILALAIFILVFYRPVKTSANQAIDIIDWAQLSICVVLFNLNAWHHNYVLLIMAYFIIIYYLIRANFKDTAILTLLIISFLLSLFTIKGFISKSFSHRADFYSPHVFSALLAFFALHKLKLNPRNKILQ